MTGYFPPGAPIRRIGAESVLMLGGGRALLMQAAHPLVASGIVEHSDYSADPWKRLGRTLLALYTVVFGTREEADRTGAIVQAVHRPVRGRQQFHHQRHASAGNRRVFGEPEQFLHADGELWPLLRFVVDRHMRAGRLLVNGSGN